ncbi:ABC transporter permease [Clostridium sp. 'deep sea']|uniref:ABC transporter permease n=1 Tax=Clostridium sp. 'deep sea' TaxID=2779445 RepID=UPI001896A3C0|nr:ABC transporter permease [Clostridium sp. 'deep sea']QOR35315.1 ABC transporter permease [Clostridium sp. 'deep sea']
MFFGLVTKELKYQLKNIVLYLLLLTIFLFYSSQYSITTDDVISLKPTTEMQIVKEYLVHVHKTSVINNSSNQQVKLTSSNLIDVEWALAQLKKISVKDKYGNNQAKSANDFANILNTLNTKLGGNTILSESTRNRFFSKAFNYGSKEMVDDHKKMKAVILNLIGDYHCNSIYTYPIGFYKKVILTEKRKQAMLNAVNLVVENGANYIDNKQAISNMKFKCTFDEFNTIMDKLNRQLGGGSVYDSNRRSSYFYSESRNYDEAMLVYQSIVKDDKYSNSFARCYCDYMGITASLFPIFLAAFVLPRDKRFKMHELINSKKIKSYSYVLAKYLAIVILLFLGYMFIAGLATSSFIKIANSSNLVIDKLAFFKYTLYWVMPTVMFVTALAMFLSVLFNNGIVVIPIQFILCMTSMLPLVGSYGLKKFFIRLNSVISYADFSQYSNQIMFNRIFYVFLSIVLVVLTSIIFKRNRSNYNGERKVLFSRNKI